MCALIQERGIPTIYGNYDYAIARDLEDCGCAYADAHDRDLDQQSVDWTLAHTDQASKDFTRELPFNLRLDVIGVPVHLAHGDKLVAAASLRRRDMKYVLFVCTHNAGRSQMADRVLDEYDDVPIRSRILNLAHKRTRECLRREHCRVLESLAG